MNKKLICLVATGLLMVASSAYAAKGANGQKGLFIGLQTGQTNVDYSYFFRREYDNEPDGRIFRESSNKVMPIEFVAGARYYVGKFGIGAKGTLGTTYYAVAFDNEYTARSDGLSYNIEGQLYYDFLNFTMMSKPSSIGLTLGAGYEIINYSSTVTVSKNNDYRRSYDNYSDASPFYTLQCTLI